MHQSVPLLTSLFARMCPATEIADRSTGLLHKLSAVVSDGALILCRFMLDDMLSLQGNTAVYLLYAHARIAAIGRKAGTDNIAALAHDHPVEVDHEKERNLAMHVSLSPLHAVSIWHVEFKSRWCSCWSTSRRRRLAFACQHVSYLCILFWWGLLLCTNGMILICDT